ncbi:ABC transporter permease [Thalassospira sp. TSL5-1]|uniref:ABC transporter permease n=1 Tax=Thalassospira sp. TSL5-1 TaxID=1544451 RepID=UPI00093C5640|nr:ABC transporter permease [Thalassospira sp. TSL5-1]OKH86540.1 membrane protein [Thalassospira sp. TSL5-1]
MSSQIKQTLVMIRANLFSLPRRLSVSLSMVLSIALVVAVLVGFLAMARGFETALSSAGSPVVAVVLGGGTNQETGSDIPASAIRNIAASGGDMGVVRDPAGNIVLSRELVVPVEIREHGKSPATTLALRGMDVTGPGIRDGITLSAGRLFRPGSREIVVGNHLAGRFDGLSIGNVIRLGSVEWTVTGHFSAHGSAFESEIWADLDTVRAAFDRQGDVQSLHLRLQDPAAIAELNNRLRTITTTSLIAVSEASLYAAQSGQVSRLIKLFGWPLTLLMAVGATVGALNTMMSSVSNRTIEIATVRALGFSRLSAFLATWFEAVILAAIGAILGVITSWLVFDGWQASTMAANNTTVGFALTVTPDIMVTAGLLSLAIGFLGGAFPALVATRLPLTAALRPRS